MANTKLLQGFRCPKCGSYEPMRVWAEVHAVIFDDYIREQGPFDMENAVVCECLKCNYQDDIYKFDDDGEEDGKQELP